MILLILLKMYTLSEEKRWYIISEWKKGSIDVPLVARYLNCHISTVYRVINYYRLHNDVSYGHSPGRPRALKGTPPLF